MKDPMTPKDYRNVRTALKRFVQAMRPVHELDDNARAYEALLKRRVNEFSNVEIAVIFGAVISLAEHEDNGLEITLFRELFRVIKEMRETPPEGEVLA